MACADRSSTKNGETTPALPTAADGNVFVAAYPAPHPVPDTTSVGSFEIANSCLVFRDMNHEVFLAVLPEGTKVEGRGADTRIITSRAKRWRPSASRYASEAARAITAQQRPPLVQSVPSNRFCLLIKKADRMPEKAKMFALTPSLSRPNVSFLDFNARAGQADTAPDLQSFGRFQLGQNWPRRRTMGYSRFDPQCRRGMPAGLSERSAPCRRNNSGRSAFISIAKAG